MLFTVSGSNPHTTSPSAKLYVLLTMHLDIIVQRKTNLMHNLFLVYFVTVCCPGWIRSNPTRTTDSHL